MQRLPVKSLVRFRLVSKQWKSLIDSPDFMKNHYRNNDTHDQHHLFVIRDPNPYHKSQYEYKYISIVDNDVYPKQKSSLTVPPPLRSLKKIINNDFTCVNGLMCFLGNVDPFTRNLAVFWNPSVGKFVAIKIPNGLGGDDCIGFGFCPDTFDPKLVRIKTCYRPVRWDVDVFTLSSRVWKRVYTEHNPLYDSYLLMSDHVCIKGCIYWRASHQPTSGKYTYVIVSFNLKDDKFGKVSLPDKLLLAYKLRVAEVNESLGVLEYDSDGSCDVWMMEFVTKLFTKMFTVKVPGNLWNYGVLGFRKNGEVIIQFEDDNKSILAAYEPSLRRVKDLGIYRSIKQGYGNYYGKYGTLINVLPFTESLLLLDQASSIIP